MLQQLTETNNETENTATSWRHASSTKEDSECPILLETPKIQDAIVFEQQYFDDTQKQWQPIKNTARIFSREALSDWFQKSQQHPLSSEDVLTKDSHQKKRWRALPLNEKNRDLVDKLKEYRGIEDNIQSYDMSLVTLGSIVLGLATIALITAALSATLVLALEMTWLLAMACTLPLGIGAGVFSGLNLFNSNSNNNQKNPENSPAFAV